MSNYKQDHFGVKNIKKNKYTIANFVRYKIQIEVFNATNKTKFVIFDRDEIGRAHV